MRLRITASVLSAGFLASCLTGCGDPDPVRTYQVAKPVADDSFVPSPGSGGPVAQAPVAWFFKLTGPAAAVVGQAESFTRLVSSVQFGADGKPNWSLPEGWTERSESGLRFATIEIPGDPKLEVSVTSLPATDPNSTEYLLSNFNRWRDQLALEKLESREALDASRERGEWRQFETGGRKVTLFNLSGKTAENPDARMLAAMIVSDSAGAGSSSARGPAPMTPPGGDAGEKPFTYTLPAGWQDAPLRTFQLAAFTAGTGTEAVTISVATAGGDLAGNINRWRGQVGLEPVGEQEIAASAKSLTVDGSPAMYFVVEGEKDSILGVIAERGGRQWFIKANGPKGAIASERERFEAFAQSLKFR